MRWWMTTQQDRNQARRLIMLSNRNHSNCIRISSNETYNHARAKFEIAMKLLEAGYEFYSEAKFEGGGRADIYVLDTMTVIECLESETEAQCAEKVQKYPPGLHFEIAYMENGKLVWKVRKEA